MLIFLYGQDTFRSKEELRKMIEENKKANSGWFDFVRIDASDKEAEVLKELKQATDTMSMFNSSKMVVVENVFVLRPEAQDELFNFLEKRNIEKESNTTLIFWCDDIDVKSSIYKYLKSKAECKEFKSLDKSQLKKWIKDFVNKQNGRIDSQAIDRIINYIGNDLWRLSNELNKLIAYKMGDVRRPTSDMYDVGHLTSRIISAEDVELFIKPEIDLNIFDLVDAIGYKNKAKALKLFNQHIEDGANEHYLLSMIVSQIRNLIKVKTAEAIELLGLHPFVVRKTSQQAEKFTFEALKKIYYHLMTIDFESKLGKTDIRTALELFITNI